MIPFSAQMAIYDDTYVGRRSKGNMDTSNSFQWSVTAGRLALNIVSQVLKIIATFSSSKYLMDYFTVPTHDKYLYPRAGVDNFFQFAFINQLND